VEADLIDHGVVASALAEQEHLKEVRKKRRDAAAQSFVRVPSERLDSLVNLVGELVSVQARLSRKASLQAESELLSISEEVERLTGELRNTTMSIRMLPIGTTFNMFKRVVRDLSLELGKEAALITEGGETELDKTVMDQLNDPLIHIIRNCIDHVIEPPDVREEIGKSRQGIIRLSAEHSGASVLIHISDDGAGISKEAVRQKAVEKGLIAPDSDLSDDDAIRLVLMPGFSTSETVTDVSGRGVGMDVVKKSIEALHGDVTVASKKDAGTMITLKLPLTLAIIDGLLVKVGHDHFVLPLIMVEECIELSSQEASKAHARHMIHFRKEFVPFISLRKLFANQADLPPVEQVVIVESKGGRIGIEVDHVIGQYQTVIKTLGRMYRNIGWISGATILGDGAIALIIDVNQLIHFSDYH
jgi:two-component system chemotaxis sensor kinase CheA